MTDYETGWAEEEFAGVELGDARLNARLIRLCGRLSEAPESPINQACKDWAETKAAYRFFNNENVSTDEVFAAHRRKTADRVKGYNTVLALQDTSYLVYTSHSTTTGLGQIAFQKGQNVDRIYSHGLAMHICFAITTQGLPLGLLDQQIFARQLRPREPGKTDPKDRLPVEEKESYRWLTALKNANDAVEDTRIITVCDREADFYDLFREAQDLSVPVLVRARGNRPINRQSGAAGQEVVKLWDYMTAQPVVGTRSVEIARQEKKNHNCARDRRVAAVEVRIGAFQLNPPKNHIKHRTEQLPNINMSAVYVREFDTPEGEEAVEWMLLTNLPVDSFEDAGEKIDWYALRWRIEMFFKVLKSGFRVENCRLGTADRLIRYLTVMSIVAWRLFMLTIIARTAPESSVAGFLSENEWKTLFRKMNPNKPFPETPPAIGTAVTWIARLGGYLARKSDPPPGTWVLWRGWKRLIDLADGWAMANQRE